MKKILPISALVLLLFPAIASAEVANSLKELVRMLVNLINTATTTLVALALVIFLFGAAYNVMKAGERGSGALRQFLVWGVIILFVMVSVWGILNVLQQTLFGSGTNSTSGGSGNSVSGSNIQFN